MNNRSKPHNAVRSLTPAELAEFGSPNTLQPGARRRRAGIEELRRALNDRFGAINQREGKTS